MTTITQEPVLDEVTVQDEDYYVQVIMPEVYAGEQHG